MKIKELINLKPINIVLIIGGIIGFIVSILIWFNPIINGIMVLSSLMLILKSLFTEL